MRKQTNTETSTSNATETNETKLTTPQYQACLMLADFVIFSPPSIPVPSRWTKLFAALDW
jgi:hypothetical protein